MPRAVVCGRGEIVTGPGKGDVGPRVAIFDATTNGGSAGTEVVAFDRAFTGGVFGAAGN